MCISIFQAVLVTLRWPSGALTAAAAAAAAAAATAHHHGSVVMIRYEATLKQKMTLNLEMHEFSEMSTQIEALLAEPMWTFIPKVNLL
jgi:hypothetical protein